MSLGGEQVHNELAFTAEAIQEIALRKGLTLIVKTNFFTTNLCYARLTFTKFRGTPYGQEFAFMNHFGGLTFDRKTGICHVQVSEQQKIFMSTLKNPISKSALINKGYN